MNKNIARLFAVRTYPARIVRWKDGDTCVVELDFGMNLRQEWDCRIDGINCWERDTEAGQAALSHAEVLFPSDTWVTCVSLKWDKYGGRIQGRLFSVDTGREFGQLMIEHGFAVAWNGRGKAPLPEWPIPALAD